MRRVVLALLPVLGLPILGLAGPAAAQARQDNPSFNLVNRAQQPINEVYATPKGMDNWGRDLLSDTTVAPGATYAVRLPVGQCTYDVRVVYGSGRSEEKRGLNTCNLTDVVFNGSAGAARGGSAAASQGGDRAQQAVQRGLSLTVTNLSTTTISSVFATPTGVDNWGEDRLGDEGIIEHQATKTISLPNEGKCLYDVRFVYSDDSTFEKRKVDLCHDPVHLRVN